MPPPGTFPHFPYTHVVARSIEFSEFKITPETFFYNHFLFYQLPCSDLQISILELYFKL